MRAAVCVLLCLAFVCLAASHVFAANWVVFKSGGVMDVAKIERVGPNLRLTRTDGVGWVTAPPDRIDWEASTARSGHPMGPDLPVSANGDGDSGTQTPPGRRTRKGQPMPNADTNSYWAFAVRVATPPKVDGLLDDEAWEHALPWGGLYLQETHEGEPATEDTEFRVVYDDKAIYFGVRCRDREPDKVIAMNMLRSATLRTDDSIRLMIDPPHDHRQAYSFGTNANGMLVDAFEYGKSDQDTAFNTIWWTKGHRDADGWTTEVAVPFKSLRFERAAEHVWGLTVSRRIARRNEFSYWPFIPNDSTFYWAGSCGHLEGIDDVKPATPFQLKPYLSGGVAKDYGTGRSVTERDAGFDFKYSFKSNLLAEFTYHTDFAQTEVDDLQVNLERFPLYYAEKRQYFLDATKDYDIGVKKEVEILYSRRIGLTEAGAPVPVLGGGRVAGKTGGYTYGALSLQTANLRGDDGRLLAPTTNWTVLGLTRDIGPRSHLGVIFTNRSGSGSTVPDNRVFGLAGRFYVGNSMGFGGFLAAVSDPRFPTGRMAGLGEFDYTKDKYGFAGSYLDVQQNFAPGIGFVSRRDIRKTQLTGRFSPRPRVLGIRRLFFEPTLNYFTTQENRLETRNRNLMIRGEFETGDTVTVRIENSLEALSKPFAIRSDAVIPVGSYPFTDAVVSFSTFPGRPLAGTLSVTTGHFYDGSRQSVGLNGMWRVNKYFNLTPSYSLNRIDLPMRMFTTHVLRTKFNVNFTALASIDGLVQWSNDSRKFVTNVRFNWIYKPGTDFYVVYTEIDDTQRAWGPKNRMLLFKINYVLDF